MVKDTVTLTPQGPITAYEVTGMPGKLEWNYANIAVKCIFLMMCVYHMIDKGLYY